MISYRRKVIICKTGIVIKSSRAGMTVLLDPNLPFEELLAAIAKKI